MSFEYTVGVVIGVLVMLAPVAIAARAIHANSRENSRKARALASREDRLTIAQIEFDHERHDHERENDAERDRLKTERATLFDEFRRGEREAANLSRLPPTLDALRRAVERIPNAAQYPRRECIVATAVPPPLGNWHDLKVGDLDTAPKYDQIAVQQIRLERREYIMPRTRSPQMAGFAGDEPGGLVRDDQISAVWVYNGPLLISSPFEGRYPSSY